MTIGNYEMKLKVSSPSSYKSMFNTFDTEEDMELKVLRHELFQEEKRERELMLELKQLMSQHRLIENLLIGLKQSNKSKKYHINQLEIHMMRANKNV